MLGPRRHRRLVVYGASNKFGTALPRHGRYVVRACLRLPDWSELWRGRLVGGRRDRFGRSLQIGWKRPKEIRWRTGSCKLLNEAGEIYFRVGTFAAFERRGYGYGFTVIFEPSEEHR